LVSCVSGCVWRATALRPNDRTGRPAAHAVGGGCRGGPETGVRRRRVRARTRAARGGAGAAGSRAHVAPRPPHRRGPLCTLHRTAALHLCTLTAPRTARRAPAPAGARGGGRESEKARAEHDGPLGESVERLRRDREAMREVRVLRVDRPDRTTSSRRNHAITGEPLYVQGDHRQDFFKYFISLFDSCRRCHAAGGRRRGPP
jgi:hypothetical protein